MINFLLVLIWLGVLIANLNLGKPSDVLTIICILGILFNLTAMVGQT